MRVTKTTDFSRDGADVAIRWGDGPWPGLVCHPLIRATFCPMLSPALAESIGGVNEPADLMKLPIISPRDHWWTDWFAAAGIHDPALKGNRINSFEAQDLEASAAIAGHGVAILSPFLFRDELASGRLLQPFALTCAAHSPIWLVYPHARRNAPKIRAFHNWIVEIIARDDLAAPLDMPDTALQNDMSGA
jgi:LysR family glycine cleavage system transcriptional activator